MTDNVHELFPLERLSSHELKVRLWELRMAGEADSDQYRAIEAELEQRRARTPASVVAKH